MSSKLLVGIGVVGKLKKLESVNGKIWNKRPTEGTEIPPVEKWKKTLRK